jgi:hypothetical protein
LHGRLVRPVASIGSPVNRVVAAHVRSDMTVSGDTEPTSQPASESASDTVSNTVSNTGSDTVSDTVSNSRASIQLAAAALAGGAVAVALGTYGRVHDPTFRPIEDLGFPSVLDMKAWLATGAAALAVVQLVSAMWMYGKLPVRRPAPSRTATVHRWSGTVAFLITLPVAYHCLWSLGFAETGARQVTHSILGCAFYGAFATKMLVLRIDRLPRLALPVCGGLLVTLLTGLWLTSSLWFFTNVGFPLSR